jgi:ribosomal protein RSM22 (predicted rRNA methylase)
VLAPARVGRGRVTLKLCQPDGVAVSRLCTRRDGALYKAARRVGWGDVLE